MAIRMVVPLALALLLAASDAQLTPEGGKKPHIGRHVAPQRLVAHVSIMQRPAFHAGQIANPFAPNRHVPSVPPGRRLVFWN